MKYEIDKALPILKDLLLKGKLNIFVGSGISIDSEIPTWNNLVDEFLGMASQIRFVDTKDKGDIQELISIAKNRKRENRFNPIEIATVLKNRLNECKEFKIRNSQAFKFYTSWITKTFVDKYPNEKHNLITSTDYKYILTSNYDDLLQSSAYDQGFIDFSSSCFSFKQEAEILKAINNDISSIIHVHGNINSININELVFTKEDYNKIILKRYPGFSFALRILFSRYSTLFVGYGASDPHLEEVMEELSEYFPLVDNEYVLPQSYLITLRKKNDVILEKYKERVGVNIILIDDFSQYEIILKELKITKQRE